MKEEIQLRIGSDRKEEKRRMSWRRGWSTEFNSGKDSTIELVTTNLKQS